jgi:Fe-S cluster assembly ATPase SufC
MSELVLQVQDLTVDLGKPPKRVLDQVGLEVGYGSIHALIGG